MSQKNVRIESLQIRLPKGFSAVSARQIAAGLGGEMTNQMARNTRTKNGTARIENLDLGKIKNGGGADLQKQIARRIAAIIDEKTK